MTIMMMKDDDHHDGYDKRDDCDDKYHLSIFCISHWA